jgi:hypothetical protein
MQEYRVVFGAYVRMYADYAIEAENNEAARKLAVEEFKAKFQEMNWCDPQYDNIALPSILSMQTIQPPGDVLEGYDFAITPSDAHQYAADKLLDALLNIMAEIEYVIDQRRRGGNDDSWMELDRKAAEARAAIAEATAI